MIGSIKAEERRKVALVSVHTMWEDMLRKGLVKNDGRYRRINGKKNVAKKNQGWELKIFIRTASALGMQLPT